MTKTEQNILAAIPINFFRNRSLTIFNGETSGLKGGAFRLRAVSADKDGNPRRSKEFLFFGNGMFSMAYPTESVLQFHLESGIWGYKYIFTKKSNAKKDGYFWEVTSPKIDTTVYHHDKDVPGLKISSEKPGSKSTILLQVEGEISQYIYIG
ncbi:MAG TPA: hypothetical protein DIC35_02195 [Candidatus Moranbacteria bacterium]|nr:hypothetical protein [Candidatus Moranbacteria bacterium]